MVSRFVPIFSAIVGLVVCFFLSAQHAGLTTPFCSDNAASGCNAVFAAPYASILRGKLPLAYLGVAFYAVLLSLVFLTLATEHIIARMTLLAMATGGLLTSVLLVGLQALVIKSFCPLCLTSAICTFAIFPAALFWLKSKTAPSPKLAATLASLLLPITILTLLFVLTRPPIDEPLAKFDDMMLRLSDLTRDEPGLLDTPAELGYQARLTYVQRKLASLAIAAKADQLGITPEELIKREFPTDESKATRWDLWTSELLKSHTTHVLVSPPVGRPIALDPALATPPNQTSAKLNLTVFSDLQCPICANLHQTLSSLQKKFGAELAVSFRHFPLRGHEYAEDAAVLAEAIFDQQGPAAFEGFISKLFSHQGNLTRDIIEQEAISSGLTSPQVHAALAIPIYRTKVQASAADARKLKLSGAPDLVLNGRLLNCSFDEATLEARLKALK